MTLARIEDRGDHIAIINRNAAKRGALSVEYYEAVMAGFKAAQERRIRAVLLTSEGGWAQLDNGRRQDPDRRYDRVAGQTGRGRQTPAARISEILQI